MAQLLRNHKQRSTTATLPVAAKPSKDMHFASQNTITGYQRGFSRTKFTPYQKARKPIGLASADRTAFPGQLHLRKKSTATMVETSSQLTQKDALKMHFQTYQEEHLPAQILNLGEKHEKKRRICRQMSKVVTDFSGRTVHDRAKTQSRFNFAKTMISRAKMRGIEQRPSNTFTRMSGTIENYGYRTIQGFPTSNVVSESSFGKSARLPLSVRSREPTEKQVPVQKPKQYYSERIRPKEIVRVYSKTEMSEDIVGDGVKMSPGFFTQYFDNLAELKHLQKTIGLLIKISGIQKFVLEDRNFMKSNLQKTSYLEAFNSQIDLGPMVVCRAEVGGFSTDPSDDDDTDTLVLPEWVFDRLKIKVGEPVSVTYDTSLVEKRFYESVALVEVQPLQKNYDEVVSAQEVMEHIQSVEETQRRLHRTDTQNIDSATNCVQLKVQEHIQQHRVIEPGQIVTIRNGRKKFDFKVTKLLNHQNFEIFTSLSLITEMPQIYLDLEHLDLNSEDKDRRQKFIDDSNLKLTGGAGERRVSKLDLDLILKQEGLNLFHMQHLLDEHKKANGGSNSQSLKSPKTKTPKRTAKSAGQYQRKRSSKERKEPSHEIQTPSGSLSIIDENSGLNQAIELQSLVANQAVDAQSSLIGRNRQQLYTAQDQKNKAILNRNLAKAPNHDEGAVSLRDRYHLRGHVQLNYVMLGDADVTKLASDEAYMRVDAITDEQARFREDGGQTTVYSSMPMPPIIQQTEVSEDARKSRRKMQTAEIPYAPQTDVSEDNQMVWSRNEQNVLMKSLKQHPMDLIAEKPEATGDASRSIISPEPTENTITKPRLNGFKLDQLQLTPRDLEDSAVAPSTQTAKQLLSGQRALKQDEQNVTLERVKTEINSGFDLQPVLSPQNYMEPIVEMINYQKGTGRTFGNNQTRSGEAGMQNIRESLQVARQISDTQENKIRDQIIATIRHSQEKAPSFGQKASNDVGALLTSRQDQKMPTQSTVSPRTLPMAKDVSMQEPMDVSGSPIKIRGQHIAEKKQSIETIATQKDHSNSRSQTGYQQTQVSQRRSQTRELQATEMESQAQASAGMHEVVLRSHISMGPGQGQISFRTKALQKLNNQQSLFYNSSTLFGIKTPIKECFRPKNRQMNLGTGIFWGKPSEFPDKQVIQMPTTQRPDSYLDMEPHTLSLTLLAESRRNKTLIEDMLGDIDMNKISLDNLKAMLELCVSLQNKFNSRLIPQHVANFFQIELINLLLQHKHNASNFANYNTTRHLKDLQAVLKRQAELKRSSQFSEGMRGKRAMSAEVNDDEKGPSSNMTKQRASGHRTQSTLAKEQIVASSMHKPIVVSTSLDVKQRSKDYEAVNRDIEKQRHNNSIQRSSRSDKQDDRSKDYAHSFRKPQKKPRKQVISTPNTALNDIGVGPSMAGDNQQNYNKIQSSSGKATQPARSPDSQIPDYLSSGHGLTPKIKPTTKEIIQLHNKVRARHSGAAQATVMVTHRTSRTRQDPDGSKLGQITSQDQDGLLMPSLAMNEDLVNGNIKIEESRPSVEMRAVLNKKRTNTQNLQKKRAQSKQFISKNIRLMDFPLGDIDNSVKQTESPHRQIQLKGYFQTLAHRLGTSQNIAAQLKQQRPAKKVQTMGTQTSQDQAELSRQFFRQFACSDQSMPPLTSGELGQMDLGASECVTPPMILDERLGANTAQMRQVSLNRDPIKTPVSSIPSNRATGFAILPPQLWQASDLNNMTKPQETLEARQQQRSVLFEGLKKMLSRPLEIITRSSYARSKSAKRNTSRLSSGMGMIKEIHKQPMSALNRRENKLKERVSELVAPARARSPLQTLTKSVQKIAQEGELNSCAAKHPRI